MSVAWRKYASILASGEVVLQKRGDTKKNDAGKLTTLGHISSEWSPEGIAA